MVAALQIPRSFTHIGLNWPVYSAEGVSHFFTYTIPHFFTTIPLGDTNVGATGAYAGAATYLPWYAVGMTLLGGVAVLIATHQTRGTPGFLAVLLPLTLLEPVALVLFHHDPMQVVQTLDICMAVTLAGLGALYVVQELMPTNQFPAASHGVDR